MPALLLVAGLGLALLLLGGGRGKPGAVSLTNEAAASTARTGATGPRGRIGPAGPRGPRGPRGPEGLAGKTGEQGKPGADAPAEVVKQSVTIGWQNGDWKGNDEESFKAPGIGTGRIRCIPPNVGYGDSGVERIEFTPFEVGTKTAPPERWATTMWTARHGGNVDDADSPKVTVVRTARLDRHNQKQFNESFNTAKVGYDPVSVGSMRGIITTEPWYPGTKTPAPTTFELSWHWSFQDAPDATNSQNRCYVSATFVSDAR